ncbi:hypothetical protein [Rhizobium sp. NRK18]|uniref:COG3904 family protein n=1 Tax=Rhizobium sp. NRK18 TaxID=2964667 RepID=UPI0021C319B0|nr:hypothetical protein [Rhizobium sp. NRK18]MCQ2003108.1 hypothetical protein [Rhizobium sp. NRK18]
MDMQPISERTSAPSSIGAYIRSHWRGEQGLWWSFAVNLALLRGIIFLAQWLLRPAKGDDYFDNRIAVFLLMILFHGVVLVWQVVGVFRAGEAHIRSNGSIAAHWGAQLGVIIAFWLTISYAFEAWQMTIYIPKGESFAARMERERTSRYQMVVDDEAGVLSLVGSIELNATRRMRELLASHPGIETVVLASEGGNIFEARGLARLIRERGLDTRVDGDCTSACTIIFIGGEQRILGPAGRLGFHQYRFDAHYVVLGNDPAKEQEKDRSLYAEAGVTSDFLARMFSKGATDMWFPTADELLDAGVATQVSR